MKRADSGLLKAPTRDAPEILKSFMKTYISSSTLFYIERNKNVNFIIVDAKKRADSEGAPPGIDEYWVNADPKFQSIDSPSFRHDLNVHEQRLYGLSYNTDDATCTFASLPDRKIKVINDGSAPPKAMTVIDGKEAQLSKVWMQLKNRFLGPPRITSVVFFGKLEDGGGNIQETIEVSF